MNNCSVFSSSEDCVEEHCIWDEGSCKGRCNIYESQTDCKKFEICFWIEGNEAVSVSVSPECVMQVYENISCKWKCVFCKSVM
jgi:hypothetical protein